MEGKRRRVEREGEEDGKDVEDGEDKEAARQEDGRREEVALAVNLAANAEEVEVGKVGAVARKKDNTRRELERKRRSAVANRGRYSMGAEGGVEDEGEAEAEVGAEVGAEVEDGGKDKRMCYFLNKSRLHICHGIDNCN
jgi:hypothetical protein